MRGAQGPQGCVCCFCIRLALGRCQQLGLLVCAQVPRAAGVRLRLRGSGRSVQQTGGDALAAVGDSRHAACAELVPPPPPAAPAELKAVDFGNNSMGKEGAAALAELLRGSQAITDVNINMNDVGNDGAFQVGLWLSHGSC